MQLNENPPVNTDTPKVSVVMSVYNGSRYLEGSVRSILNQTFQDFEFIIVNDGSTDNTEEILKQFSDPRIRIIKNSENLGLTKSLNKGIAVARGKYIARMDADDISLPNRLETQLRFLENNPDHALVGTKFSCMDEVDNVKFHIDVPTTDSSIRKLLMKQNCFAHGSVMMRKDAFGEVGGYNENFRFAQDYDLWLRITEISRAANIEEPLYKWRSFEDNTTGQKITEQFFYATLARSNADERRLQKTSSNDLKRDNSVHIINEAENVRESQTNPEEQINNWKKTAVEMSNTIKEMRSYIEEMEQAKVWLVDQWQNHKKLAEERQAYIQELEKAKAWLAEQLENNNKLAEERQAYIQELEKAKAWLEEQRKTFERLADERQSYIQELEKGKAWLEEQYNNWKKLAEERQAFINELEQK